MRKKTEQNEPNRREKNWHNVLNVPIQFIAVDPLSICLTDTDTY